MSRKNVEIVRSCLAARGRGDYRGSELFDPGVVVDLTARPDGRVYRGREEAAEAMRAWVGMWDDYAFEPEQILDAGEQVVVLFRETGRAKKSGALVQFLGATVWTLRAGRVVHTKTYTDRREALEAVGLRE